MKSRPILFSATMVRALLDGSKTQTRRIVKFNAAGRVGRLSHQWHREHPGAIEACPYGQPGDRLWVRETFAAWWVTATGKRSHVMGFRADINDENWDGFGCDDPWWLDAKWEPSIHMPRAFSRITLEIVSVRVERLQGISEADAQKEGCALECMTPTGDDSGSAIYGPGGFLALWESINGAGSWDANPWVWCVSFRRVDAS